MGHLIIGASRGVGKALWDELTSQNLPVWGVARSVPDWYLSGDGARFSACDMALLQDHDTLIEELQNASFVPQVIYINAGVYSVGESHFNSMKSSLDNLDINLRGPVLLTIKFLEAFGAKTKLQFIYTSSLFALMPDSRNVAYAAAKAGLSMAVRSFRLNEAYGQHRFKQLYLGPTDTTINATPRKTSGRLQPQAVARKLYRISQSNGNDFFLPASIRLLHFLSNLLPGDWLYKTLYTVTGK